MALIDGPHGPLGSRSLSGFEAPLCGRIAFMADSPAAAAPGLGNGITGHADIQSEDSDLSGGMVRCFYMYKSWETCILGFLAK